MTTPQAPTDGHTGVKVHSTRSHGVTKGQWEENLAQPLDIYHLIERIRGRQRKQTGEIGKVKLKSHQSPPGSHHKKYHPNKLFVLAAKKVSR